jgi:hypothetical protein
MSKRLALSPPETPIPPLRPLVTLLCGLSMKALNALGEYLQLTIHLGRKPEKKGK